MSDMKKNLRTLMQSVFGNRFWYDTSPADIDRAPVFCVAQRVGGRDEWYVSQELPEWQQARMQFKIMGRRRQEVDDAADLLREVLAASIAQDVFVVEPLGAPVDDYNEILDVREARLTYNINYRTVQAPPTTPVEDFYLDDEGNTYADESGNTYSQV